MVCLAHVCALCDARCLVRAYPQVNPPNLFISQDGSVATVAKVITNFISRAGSVLPAGVQVKHLHHKQVSSTQCSGAVPPRAWCAAHYGCRA